MKNECVCDEELIYDVGAHCGEDSDLYLKLGYRVVAIEANPQMVERLSQRFAKEIAEGRYAIIPNAVGNSDGEITFYVNRKNSMWGTANPAWALRNKLGGSGSEEIKVRSVRLEDIVGKHGCPAYLKIDIEGADMLCVEALEQLENRPKYVSIESTKLSWSKLLEEFRTFERLGYTRFQVVDQKKHEARSFKKRNGEAIEYVFEEGATGAFGDYLTGKWISRRQAILRYVPIFFLYKTLGDNTMLPKLLCHIPVLRIALDLVSWYDTHASRA